MALTVREVLAHPLLRSAEPKVLSGDDGLDRIVRWVHSADLYDIAALLRGGEVLLTNGVGLIGVDESARRLYVRRLAERHVAGLFFEVGRTFAEVPADMVDEARDQDFPIVELQPNLRFAEVAEAVNSELIEVSVARLRHADETSRALSEALARGATLAELVEQIAITLGTWARLSDYAGQVVVEFGPHDPAVGDAGAEVPVLVDGTAWGRLAIGASGPPALLCDAVLDRAPTVLGLCLIRERKGVAGALRAQQLLLEQLVANRPTDRGALESRLHAAGIATSGRQYVCVAVDPKRVPSAARLADALISHAGHGIAGFVDGLLCGVLAGPLDDASQNLAETVYETSCAVSATRNRLCVSVGRVVTDFEQLPRAMAETRATLTLAQDLDLPDPVVGVQTLALERLLATHVDMAAMRAFVEDQVGVLERVDSARGGQLLKTLEVLVACAGSKSEAAKRLDIRRQSLYYRLDLITRLLQVDLDDAKQLTTLAVAMTARKMTGSTRR